MKSFISAMDKLPKIVKIILALPFLDIVWVVYRLIKSISKKNTLGIVLAILLLIFGIPFLWLIDIITIIISDKVLWLD
ncbi:MAG: hypothetical protein GX959_01535 [Clostridiales bacterium]|jgi:hypothetical protein|nr:hypothetical protein [Clostridiales bacterium]